MNISPATYRYIIRLQMALEVMNIFNQCKQITYIYFNVHDFFKLEGFYTQQCFKLSWYNLETLKPDGTFVNTLADTFDIAVGFKVNMWAESPARQT